MATSIISSGNPAFLFSNQTITQMLYSPLITFGLDYIYSTQMDKLSSANARQLGMYSAATSFITSVINDNILVKLNTQNNMYFISQRTSAILMGPILNAVLYLWMTRQFKNNIAYYNASDVKTMIKAASIYFISDNLSDLWISFMTK